MNQIIALGHWHISLDATFCSPLLMTPKPGADPPYRPTCNMKNVNQIFLPLMWPFPDIKVQFQRIANNKSCFFGTTDVQGGFFQILIHKSYRKYFAIMTDKIVIVPERLIQGSTDAAKYFQGQLAIALNDMIPEKNLQWIDDFIMHASNLDKLMDTWEEYFKVCE